MGAQRNVLPANLVVLILLSFPATLVSLGYGPHPKRGVRP